MNNYKTILAVIGIVVGFIGYVPYIRDVLAKRTKPHTFSWLAWTLLETIAFVAQVAKGGGAGTWVLGFSAMVALFITCIALIRRDTEIHLFDWIALSGAVVGIILWALTKNPLTAVILVTLSDALAFIPTFRKSFYKPEQETLVEYSLSAVKFIISIFALQSLNLTTYLYPISLIVTNSSFVIMSLIRRKTLQKK